MSSTWRKNKEISDIRNQVSSGRLADVVLSFSQEREQPYQVSRKPSEREVTSEHAKIVNSLVKELDKASLIGHNRRAAGMGKPDFAVQDLAVFEVKTGFGLQELQLCTGQLFFNSVDIGEAGLVHKIAVVPAETPSDKLARLRELGILVVKWNKRGKAYSFTGLKSVLATLTR